MIEDEPQAVESSLEGQPVPPKWKTWHRADREHSAKWREEARTDYDFVAGKQWSEEDKRVLLDEQRPAITFNRTGVMVDAVSGNEIANRQEVRYLPREPGDAVANEILTESARWFDDESDAPDEESEAFSDVVICGMGWTETRLDFDEDPDGTPITDRIDPLEMMWDAGARKSNLKDSRRRWRVKEVDIDEAREQFPNVADSDLDAGNWLDADDKEGDEKSNEPENYYSEESDGINPHNKRKVRLVHLQYWEYQPVYRALNPISGQIEELAEEEFTQAKANIEALGGQIKYAKQRKRVYKQAIIGRKVLKHGPSPCPDHFTWNCITGKRDRNAGTWYGLVRAMKDPQTWSNKWMSQLLHIMNSNAKGGAYYEEGVFTDQQEAEENYAKPNALIAVQNGALSQGRIQERTPAQFPAGYQMLTEFAISAIRDVTGINMELLGMREANQAGVLEYQRRQAGMTVLAGLFNSLKRYRRARGKVMLYFIQNHLSDGRLVRIAGDGKEQYVPLVKQADVRYDIIIDDTPTSPNQKEAVWGSLTQILPGIKDMIPPKVMLELLEYSPLPSSLVEKIKGIVEEPDPAAAEAKKMQVQAAMLEMAKSQSEIEKTKSESQENVANAQHSAMQARDLAADTEIKTAMASLGIVQ